MPSACVSPGLLLAATDPVLPAPHGSALLADQRGLPGSGGSGQRGERTGLPEDLPQRPLRLSSGTFPLAQQAGTLEAGSCTNLKALLVIDPFNL